VSAPAGWAPRAPAGRTAALANAGLRMAGLAASTVALVIGAGAAIALTAVMAIAGVGDAEVTVSPSSGGAPGQNVSALALREIPREYLRLYEAAAARYGLDWAILAGIGKVECDHGRDPAPSCTREGAVNSAGAGGPMQFLASTWAVYGVSVHGSGLPDRWSPVDAIYGAANYLRASGAPGDYEAAIYAYNHARWYVREVKSWARRYSVPPVFTASGSIAAATGGDGGHGEDGGGGYRVEGADASLASETRTPVRFISGARAMLAPGDGHVALIPAGAPATVQAMVVAGNELQDLPYGPGGHPDPRGASSEDCSSTLNYVLYRSGVRSLSEIVAENPLAQDYVRWGVPGPGRWVTIYATDEPAPHVFVVIAGLRLDTSYDGTDVGPNRDEGGPRWRVYPHIPAWAHWSVRHPPGL
jgi:Transglycosylase SLT domain